ncbi:MAG: methyltransferase domain-containing protein [Myxococcales bacterium]|nr:methyltransferase domain-containing protein [Myxococcales bacterium]
MRPRTPAEVERWNDNLAEEHDIDDYYAHSGVLIRAIELRRLELIRTLVAPRPGERLLEVGCGGGHVLARFGECELVGVDVSGAMLDKARKNLAGYRVTLHKGELGNLALPDASFDAVVCTEVLEHVVDPEAVLGHIRRLVRPTGRAVITFPNDHLVNTLKSAVRRAGLTRLPPFRRISWGGDHYHFHVWRIPEMRALLERFFRVEREAFAPHRLAPIRCCFRCVPR